VDVGLFVVHVGAVCGVLLISFVCDDVLGLFSFQFGVVCKKGRLVYCLISFQILLYFLLIFVAFGKFEAVNFLNYACQETTGLNVLAVDNWIKALKVFIPLT
jgi:hypothetical protein